MRMPMQSAAPGLPTPVTSLRGSPKSASPDHPPDRTHAWIWDVERRVWQLGPMGSPDCICGVGPCKGCAYGKAKKDGPMWWAKP